MTTIKKLIEHLKNSYKPDDVVAAAIWQVEDVFKQAKEKEIKVTREQAEGIIDRIDRRQDATVGINWDTIDAYLDDLED